MQADWQQHQDRLSAYIEETDFTYPADRFSGRGVVICMGGRRYFTNGYVAIRRLRAAGCTLPITIVHRGTEELTPAMRQIITPMVDTIIDALALREEYPVRILNGWETKPYAILHSPYQEVLLLDADNVVCADPTYLFDSEPYGKHGVIFWPDFGRLARSRAIWEIVGVEYRDEPEFETGQIIIDKKRCWKALNVTMFLNEWSDFYYNHIHGDKETFHMAWRRLGQEYAMPSRGIDALSGTMCQHDFGGNRVFQHRNMRKWSLDEPNLKTSRFQFEEECLGYLEELREQLETIETAGVTPETRLMARQLMSSRFAYCRVGHDFRRFEFRADGTIGEGSGGMEKTWKVTTNGIEVHGDQGLTMIITADGDGVFYGRWLVHEKMPVRFVPIR